MLRNTIFIVALATFLGGCAHVDVSPLAANDTSTKGVRFYAPEPYLLVGVQPASDKATPAAGGNAAPSFQMQVIWLPNLKQGYVADVKTGWGTVNGNVTLQNGWMLSTLGANLDSKGPETITAVGSLLTAATTGAAKFLAVGEVHMLAPGLYHINIDPVTGLVRSLDPVKIPE